MSLLLQLKKQNEQLLLEKQQMEQDMVVVAMELKNLWLFLGLKEDTFSENMNMAQMLKLASTVGRKFMPGSKGKEELAKSWEKVQPILLKYQHLIKEADV